MTATLNGKPDRKQLSDQLNRLDGILDVLADALPQAVADACKEGAKQAMKEAVVELLSNPDVRALLAAKVPDPTPAPKPSWWAKLKAEVRDLKDALVERAKGAFTTVTTTARLLTAVLPWRRIALVAGGVGLTVGLLCLICPPLVAAGVSALGGAVVTVTAQVTGTLRQAGLLAH